MSAATLLLIALGGAFALCGAFALFYFVARRIENYEPP